MQLTTKSLSNVFASIMVFSKRSRYAPKIKSLRQKQKRNKATQSLTKLEKNFLIGLHHSSSTLDTIYQ